MWRRFDPSPEALTEVHDHFWGLVEKSSTCWEWAGWRNPEGYGGLRIEGQTRELAHRVAWVMYQGAIPGGLCVLHKCDNPPCVRPCHLFLGTWGDNNRDTHQKGRARPARGERSGTSKLTEDQVHEIRSLSEEGVSGVDLAHRFNVTSATISNIIHRITWKHLTSG